MQPPSSSTEPAGLAQGSKALNCRLGSRMCQGSRAKAPGIECRSLLARQRRAAPHRNPSPFNGDGPVAAVLGQNALTQRILGVGGAATPRLQRRCRRSASQGQHASPAHDRVSRLLPGGTHITDSICEERRPQGLSRDSRATTTTDMQMAAVLCKSRGVISTT